MRTAEEVTRCPQCEQQVRVTPKYVTWCDRCEWNVDPTPPVDPTPAWRLRLEQRLADQLYKELEKGRIHRPEWDAARVVSRGLAAATLSVPLAGLLGGTALLLFYRPLWLSIVLALPGLALQPQERVALLAHELGHGTNGDAEYSWLMNSAWSVLAWLRSSQRAEYLADRRAAEIAGSEAPRRRWSGWQLATPLTGR